MKKSCAVICALVILSAIALGSSDPWDRKKKHEHNTPESGAVPMLVLALSTVTGGVILKRRRNANNPA